MSKYILPMFATLVFSLNTFANKDLCPAKNHTVDFAVFTLSTDQSSGDKYERGAKIIHALKEIYANYLKGPMTLSEAEIKSLLKEIKEDSRVKHWVNPDKLKFTNIHRLKDNAGEFVLLLDNYAIAFRPDKDNTEELLIQRRCRELNNCLIQQNSAENIMELQAQKLALNCEKFQNL